MKTLILSVAMTTLLLISCGILDTPKDVVCADSTKVDSAKVDSVKVDTNSVGTGIKAPLDTVH